MDTIMLDKEQKQAVESNHSKILVVAGSGSGKAQPVDMIIPTPSGMKVFGDLKIGDYVFDREGKSTRIVGVFPQGEKEVYKVTLEDGRSTECCIEHLWSYNYDGENFTTSTLKEMIDAGFSHSDGAGKTVYNFYLPYNQAVDYPIKQLTVSPYNFGCELSNWAWKGVKEVIIPEKYLQSSIEQRKSLLQGVIDNAMGVEDKGKIVFSIPTNAATLCESIKTLCWSLGMRAPIVKKSKTFYHIIIDTAPIESVPIVKIESLGVTKEMMCISVDNPEQLYLTNNFIVTHNTRVLTERIKFLLDKGVDPRKIVAITFTRMAADEMSERLGRISDLFVGTIHSYAHYLSLVNGIPRELWDSDNEKIPPDFDRLLKLSTKVKNHEHIEYLLIDEFQDVGKLEYKFLTSLKPRNFMYVGDDWQAIYGFKGGNVNFFLDLISDKAVKKYYLSSNYRSGINIIEAAGKQIRQIRKKTAKTIRPLAPYDGIVIRSELEQGIDSIFEDGNYKDWFVLARTNQQLSHIEKLLGERWMPSVSFKKADITSAEMNMLLKKDAIKLLTIHSAKGLESKNVLVTGMQYWSDDELRVNYVGFTRAKEKLIICD